MTPTPRHRRAREVPSPPLPLPPPTRVVLGEAPASFDRPSAFSSPAPASEVPGPLGVTALARVASEAFADSGRLPRAAVLRRVSGVGEAEYMGRCLAARAARVLKPRVTRATERRTAVYPPLSPWPP